MCGCTPSLPPPPHQHNSIIHPLFGLSSLGPKGNLAPPSSGLAPRAPYYSIGQKVGWFSPTKFWGRGLITVKRLSGRLSSENGKFGMIITAALLCYRNAKKTYTMLNNLSVDLLKRCWEPTAIYYSFYNFSTNQTYIIHEVWFRII